LKGIRLVAFVLFILLAVTSSIAFAEQDDGSEPDPTLSAAPVADPGTEIVADRTANSETFRLPDGERETRIYAEPVNYEDSGEWRPIGSALRESEDGAALTNGENDFEVTLPQQLDSDPARISFGEQWISSQLLGTNTGAVQLEDKTAAYESAQGSIAISYSGLANGLKEDIELSNSSQPSSFTFQLKTSPGLTPTLTETGDLEFRDEGDQLVATLPAPLMYDSAPEHPATSHAIHYELEPAAEGWRLKVEADREWLEQPERVWPVHLDPSTVKISPKEAGNFDCAINGRKGTKGTTICGSKGVQSLSAAYWPKINAAEDEWARVLMYFDIHGNQGPLPKGAYVTDATLGMRASEAALNTSGIELGLVNRKVLGANQGLNWLEYEKNKPWIQEGGDYKEIVGKVTTAERGPAAGWWNVPLAVKPIMELAESKLEGQVKFERIALLTKLIDDKSRECSTSCTQRQIKFESSAATTPENRPYLSLKYFMPAPAAAKLASPMDGTESARRVRLKATWEAGVTGVSFQYRLGSKGRFEDIPAELVKDAEGKAVAEWPIAVKPEDGETENFYLDTTVLEPKFKAEKGKFQVRSFFIGGTGYDGYSTPSTVNVDPDLGGPSDAMEAVGPGTVDLLTGNYTVSRTDFTIPAPLGGVDVSRTHNSRDSGPSGDTSVFGRGWQPTSMIEAAGGADWRSVREFPPTAEEAEEGFGGYVHLTDLKGAEHTFEKEGGLYLSPPELEGWTLTQGVGTFTLSDSMGNKTVFSNGGSGPEYLPIQVTTTGEGDNSAKYVYELPASGKRRLKTVVAAGGYLSCGETSKGKIGCHALEFTYKPATTWGAPAAYGDRLSSVTYWGPEGPNKQGHWEVAKYEYDSAGRLIAEWDPRLASPLKETYTYVAGGAEAAGQLRTLSPPGQEAWTFEYKALAGENAEVGRLSTVKRPSLVASPSTAQTTIAYGVPVSGGSGAPNMSLGEISKWGQEDLPVEATAIFGPDEVPASPPSSYAKATIVYMDADGMAVNTVAPTVTGAGGPSISTTEADEFGNVVRELTPQNRLRALSFGAGSAAKSREIDSKFKFSKDGTQLQEEWGPLHQARIEKAGETKPARSHTLIAYEKDQVIATTTGAWVAGKAEDADQRETRINYDWTLLEPTEVIVDPGGLNLKTVTAYDKTTGQVIERRTPGGEKPGDANTTRYTYFKGGPSGGCFEGAGAQVDGYVGLLCEVGPGGQPGTAGLPELPVTKYAAYNSLGEPTEVRQNPGGKEEATRKTITTYDSAGRVETSRQIGGGKELPPTKTIYNTTTGLPVERTLSCESCDTQAVVVAYDKLGRPVKYTDADGSTSETTYDLLGRPATIFDGKGTQKFGYDSTSGLLTMLEDSNAGTFTAAYDADGNMVERGLPNGLVAKTTYDEVGAPTKLSYTKTSCSEKCTWLDESNERSIFGQILSQKSLASSQQYSYDKAGRLELVKDTPQGGGCTTRKYEFDQDSNRKALLTRASGGACDTKSAVTPQEYTYDAADRLTDPEIAYDLFGRITSLPGKYAGGGALATTFYSNDMIATQSQAGLTNTYQLDAEGRPRQVVQTGAKTGTEVLHYALASDSTAWTERSGTWTRNITGIGGELAAIQESSGTTSLQLANLHGDIVATASLSLSAKEPTSNREFDEFGNPTKGSAGRYAWLGGKQRRTELPSGVTQMGVRSYIPALGRFLSPDPVEGGSANAYDYSDQDPVNGLDLDGRVSGCGVEVWAFSENHRIYSYADYNCNSGAWPFGHSLVKVEVRFERHTKGWWDETFIGEFETKGHAVWSPSNPSDPKWRHLKLRENYRCGDLGREYRITYILTVKYSSPVNGVVASSTDEVKGSGRVKCLR
jgi:RHS repeat-associated protein